MNVQASRAKVKRVHDSCPLHDRWLETTGERRGETNLVRVLVHGRRQQLTIRNSVRIRLLDGLKTPMNLDPLPGRVRYRELDPIFIIYCVASNIRDFSEFSGSHSLS